MFYAYNETITTTRTLEDKCQRDLHFMCVSGNLRLDLILAMQCRLDI